MSEQKGHGSYVYGVVPAGVSLDALGHDGDELPAVALIEAGDLATIVAEAPEDETATREAVPAHSKVPAAAVESSPVVPPRFASVYASDAGVRDELLPGRWEEPERLLEKVEGRRADDGSGPTTARTPCCARPCADEPDIARLRAATRDGPEEATYDYRAQLGELVNAAIEQRRQRDGAQIMERLKPVAVAGLSEAPEKELMLPNAPFLVERSRLADFSAAVEEVARERHRAVAVQAPPSDAGLPLPRPGGPGVSLIRDALPEVIQQRPTRASKPAAEPQERADDG